MEKKKIIGIALGTVFVLIILIVTAILFFKLGTQKALRPSPSFSSMNLSDGMLITEKDKQPELVTGTVKSVSGDKMVVKQFANFDIGYEIKKEDVKTIFHLGKNPDFDPTKLEEKQKEIQEELKRKGINLDSLMDQQKEGSIELPKEMTDLQNNPSLRETVREDINWNEISEGEQISVKTLENGKREITVYSKEFDIGPPGKTDTPVGNN